MMIKLIPKIVEKLAGKTMIVTLVKNVSDITISAWLIEASALTR
jgi:bifunctional N-acetylglucosamine-1-phosphate-uridyltransferase/glucosamine-1-phosphate-acetyltransferase GlmU-like protein